MTKSEASEWVHAQLIAEEMDGDELVSAFTVLAERAPLASDRRSGMFRRCCEMVISSSPAARPSRLDAPATPKRPTPPSRGVRSMMP